MRAFAALVVIALALAGCGEDDEAAAPEPALADLQVTVDPDGDGPQPAREAQVRCAAPDDSPACRAAANLTADELEPVPEEAVCTLQYGGPDTARISGTLRGEDVDAEFSRTNGCEINRWEQVEPLLEAA